MFDVITIGSATRDGFFVGVDFLPVQGKCFVADKGLCFPLGAKLKVPQVYFLTGGSATNTAVTFARQGLKTAMICRVGRDVSGETIQREAQAEKVETKFIQQDKKNSTAYSVIFLTPQGERTILSYKGCAEKLAAQEIPWKKIKTRWLCLGSLGLEKGILQKVIRFGVHQQIKMAINPGWNELAWLKKHPQWVNKFDIFICNQEEAAYFTGIPYNKEKQIFKKLDNLVKGIVVMTKGKNGASVSDGEYVWQAGVFQKKAVDATGAGDAFASAFIAAFIKSGKKDKKLIEEAIFQAMANSGSVVTRIGAKTGILRSADFKKYRSKKLIIKKYEL